MMKYDSFRWLLHLHTQNWEDEAMDASASDASVLVTVGFTLR